MKINGEDIRKYGAKQLTVEVQPPRMAVSYEMIEKALLPVEYKTDIPLGSMKLTLYFREKDRARLQRTLSSFMKLFERSCTIEEIKGYKGKYKGYLTEDSYTKTLMKEKKILEMSFDGFFFDEEKEVIYDGKTSGTLYADGSRKMPCVIEITAKVALDNYRVTLNGEEYIIERLAAGKTIIIDGVGKVTLDGVNAFNVVDLWEFPRLHAGENALAFSSAQAKVRVRYVPTWL